jgi:hypothetical protein
MVALLLLAALQTPPGTADMARTLLGPEAVSNRLDCESRSSAVGSDPLYPAYRTHYVFLFPIRPEYRSAEERRQVRFIRSMDDGRSWIVDARTEGLRWERWPGFAARVAVEMGWIDLQSDPARQGRIVLSGTHLTNHGPSFEESGECRFVPEVPTDEAPAS